MASQSLLQGILKPSGSSHTGTAKSPEEARQIAVQHALILEQQKEVQRQIFEAVETLTTYPTTQLPASSPSPTDTSTFKSLLRPFQPSDYDDLIEERNIAGHCGYALCPAPRRSRPGAGKFSLVNKNRADFGIIETKEVEKWCSERCARRALYIKVQLNETAAWERIGVPGLVIDLLEEPRDTEDKKSQGTTDLARDIANLKIDEDAKALDAERVGSSGRKIELTIREKTVTSVANPPQPDKSGRGVDGHLMLEGHKSSFGSTRDLNPTTKKTEEVEDVDDDDDEGDLIYGGVKMSAVTISQESDGGLKISSRNDQEKPGKDNRQVVDDEDEIWRQMDALRNQA